MVHITEIALGPRERTFRRSLLCTSWILQRGGVEKPHMSVADVDSRFMNVKSDQVPLSEALNSWAGLGELVLHTNKTINIFRFWSIHI